MSINEHDLNHVETFPEVERLIEIQPEALLADLCFWQGIHLFRGLAVESPGCCNCHLETAGGGQKLKFNECKFIDVAVFLWRSFCACTLGSCVLSVGTCHSC